MSTLDFMLERNKDLPLASLRRANLCLVRCRM